MKKIQISWKYLILLFIFKVSAYPSIYSNHNFLHNNNNNNNQKNKNGRNLALNGIDFRTLEELKFPSNILEYLDLSEYNQNLNFKQQQQQQQEKQQQQQQQNEQQQAQLQNEQQQEKQLNQRRHKMLNVQNWPTISIIHDLKSIRSQKHLFTNKHNDNDNDDDDDDNDDISTNMLSKLMIFGKELYKQNKKRNEKQNDDQDKIISIKDYNSNENYINANDNLNIIDDNKDLITDSDNHNINYEIDMKKLNCLSRLHNNSIEICENFQDQKPNTFKTIMKREKIKSSRQTQFIPSISVGAMNNLGDFFDNLKHNVDILEKNKLTEHEEKLLEGDHIISTLRKQLLSYNDEDDNNNNNNIKPASTAAFLHAVRTYRPSSRIRALVSMQPDGYHGSNFLDPNYMWLGLGK